MKRKNTRAPCRIRREGITCRGVVPFVFRRRRDVLFFSFFLKKTRRGSGRLVFLFFRRGVLPPTFIAINLPAICRGGIHPSRTPSAAASGHGGQRAGRPTPLLENPRVGRGALTPPKLTAISCLFVLTFFFTFPGKYATI